MAEPDLQISIPSENTDQDYAIRAALYNLFATALGRKLDEYWLDPYFQMHLKASFPEVSGKIELLDALRKALMDQEYLREVQLDYDALLIVPGPKLVFPYESCYTHPNPDGTFGRLWQEPAQDMYRILKEWGIEFAEGWDLIPDHIAIELFFMAELCRLEKEKPEELEELKGWQQSFFRVHLVPWVFSFIDNLEHKAGTGFYRGVVMMLRSFLREEQEALGILR